MFKTRPLLFAMLLQVLIFPASFIGGYFFIKHFFSLSSYPRWAFSSLYLMSIFYLCIRINFYATKNWVNFYREREIWKLFHDEGFEDEINSLKLFLARFIMIPLAGIIGGAFLIKPRIIFLIISCLVFYFADDWLTKWKEKEFIRCRVKDMRENEEKRKKEERRFAILLEKIEEEKQHDPLVNSKMVAKEILGKIMPILADKKTHVHAESLFCALGALAGFCCHLALLQIIRDGNFHHKIDITAITVTDDKGKKYIFCEGLNDLLIKYPTSIWMLSLATKAPYHKKNLPDLNEIFKHVTNSIGTEKFGIPRYPKQSANQEPVFYVRTFSRYIMWLLKRYQLAVHEWPVAMGFAIQSVLNRNILPTEEAIMIVMESAIPMSKIPWPDELSD